MKSNPTRRNGAVGNVGDIGGAAGDVGDNMVILAEPAVSGNLEEVGSFSWVRDQDPTKQISSMRCDIVGEGQGSCRDVFVQQVDIVAFGVGRIIVEGKISS